MRGRVPNAKHWVDKQCGFAKQIHVLSPQPTMRTEKDIGPKNPETTTVSGFFRYEKIINQDDAGVMSPRANNSKVVSEANSRAVVNDRLTATSPFVALRHFPHTVGDSTVDCQSGVGRHVQQTLRTEGLFADFGAF